MTVIGFIGATATGAVGSGSAKSGAPKATLTTTRNNSVGVLVWAMTSITLLPGRRAEGQTAAHQCLAPVGDTYWVQME